MALSNAKAAQDAKSTGIKKNLRAIVDSGGCITDGRLLDGMPRFHGGRERFLGDSELRRAGLTFLGRTTPICMLDSCPDGLAGCLAGVASQRRIFPTECGCVEYQDGMVGGD